MLISPHPSLDVSGTTATAAAPEYGQAGEADAAVTWQREREPEQRGAYDDGRDRPRVDEPDRRPRRVGSRPLGACEHGGERQPCGQPGDSRGEAEQGERGGKGEYRKRGRACDERADERRAPRRDQASEWARREPAEQQEGAERRSGPSRVPVPLERQDTIQFAATTESPNVAPWSSPSRTSGRPPTIPRLLVTLCNLRAGATARTAPAIAAAASALQYGARQSSAGTSSGTIAIASPPPANVAAP